ncbi:MAG TPA: DUF5011 domain-containing protein [Phycisphaerae bacterium]|jgi:hypothetical protein|nr:DUF5011 domain-containing protein [Phycisphaerae bacterium]HOJ53652.1 DUF5011 domain-containing protein [Phycisphaerae bacterium]HOL26377.1 DUF5011 domain-containing protein [Phycisphaerae bacterium]HPP21115.1 DUF5011 domain-containing protein [Phycisphaerae bacterium]HPU35000.1 DUF5011 domain-containing protein [Phycisphaerae bacterium]
MHSRVLHWIGCILLVVTLSGQSCTPTGPSSVDVQDTTPPTLTVMGPNPATVERGDVYRDYGAVAFDADAGDLTSTIQVTGTVDTSVVGSHTLTYSVSDGVNPPTTATRTVNVVDTTPPVITLTGAALLDLECGGTYEEPGATASGADDNSIVVTGQPENPLATGVYLVRYNVSDAAGNPAEEKTRFVVVHDSTAPVISLIGPASLTIDAGEAFVDPGATASDSCSGDLTDRIVTENEVNPDAPGVYTITYNVVDFSGNAASATRTVTVQAVSSVQWAANYAGPGVTASSSGSASPCSRPEPRFRAAIGP